MMICGGCITTQMSLSLGCKYNKTEKYAEQECERIPLSKPKSFCGQEGFFCNRKSGVKNKKKSSKIGEVIGNYSPIEQNYLICMSSFYIKYKYLVSNNPWILKLLQPD